MEEIWKDIEGYEGLYQVSNLGFIKSLPRKGTINNIKILNPFIDKDGYEIVTLSKNNKRKKERVHRLVAKAFIPNPNNFPVINHKNHNKKDNNYENLEWCTFEYNARYSHNRKILQYNNKQELLKEWNSIAEAAQTLKLSKSSISLCCSGRYKKCGDFIWKYKTNT